ncbi:hypothetical protein [Ferruginibacter sp.]
MISKLFFTGIFLMAINAVAFPQEKAVPHGRRDTVHLLFYKFCSTIIPRTKNVILYRDSVITIETDLAYIIKLEQDYKKQGVTSVLGTIINNANKSTIDATKMFKEEEDKIGLKFIIAKLLDDRNCWVSNNDPPILECNITRITYTFIGSFDSGLTQSEYYLDKHFFLRIVVD